MSDYSGTGTHSDHAGEWLMATARRNPEALLLVGAGLCLLMRSASWSSRRAMPVVAYRRNRDSYQTGPSYQTQHESGSRPMSREFMSQAGEVVSRAADNAAEYASNMKQRVTEAAGTYADTVSRYTQNAGRLLYTQSERLGRQAQSTVQDTIGRIVREQPLAVAAAGLAAGAAIAAIFPSTRIESQSFGGAREALTEAASKVSENLVGAAAQAGERLASAATERGISPDGLKNLAGEAAETFANAMKSGDTGRASPSIAPQHPGSSSDVGRSGMASASSTTTGRNRP